ncbi:phosphogluconate dehydrogenase (NAD(+)-dependent, decarboxylating) [Christiangramia sp.]|uniref:phosphogluconate dehydrogenase (NAD(+)-dependent, decarboxylating) n=1 Tax=Christiangramia sp. TaxID=1931228 RepID=UPI0026228A70|nr:decarboxylating 6-phosphogluconate dehydrogenase [Christiangramia sp.]
MENIIKSFATIGLGRIGGNLALHASEKGYDVIGVNRHEMPEFLQGSSIKHTNEIEDLAKLLPHPRLVFLYIPAGKAIDAILDQLINEVLEEGDIIVDGGNSYWGDSVRRAKKVEERKIYYLDCGTSGGATGAKSGACFMVGGAGEPVRLVEPVLKDLAVPDGFVYAGPSGAGHYVKLVHNGIEFGMLQAIGEGMHLLENSHFAHNIEAVLKCWNNGSVIRSWLIQLMEEQYKEQEGLRVPSYVEDTGEVNWLVEDAMHLEVPIPVIAQSVMQLLTSRDKDKKWAKAIAMMRHGFGEHPFGENETIKNHRKKGKVGGFIKRADVHQNKAED